MFYCTVDEFHLRKESYSFDDGTAIGSERIFIYNTVKDLERFNDGDDGVLSTIIIVKGIDIDYLKMITPNTGVVGGAYKSRGSIMSISFLKYLPLTMNSIIFLNC